MEAKPQDRRDGPRVNVQRGAKMLVQGRGGRFLPARTVNVSARGVLLEVNAARALEVGEDAQVGIEWHNPALLRASGMIPGCIMRAERTAAGAQRVAIRLERSLAEPQAAGAPLRAAA